MSHNIIIALGSNLGDRLDNLDHAVQSLPPDVQVVRLSSVYETKPWGYLDQPDFLNQVLQAETELNPAELLKYLKRIETKIGRRASFRYGPRAIDLDILFYNELILNVAGLIIPHPRLAERAFVLVPLAELEPDKIHPVLGITIRGLLSNLDRNSVHVYRPSSATDSV